MGAAGSAPRARGGMGGPEQGVHASVGRRQGGARARREGNRAWGATLSPLLHPGAAGSAGVQQLQRGAILARHAARNSPAPAPCSPCSPGSYLAGVQRCGPCHESLQLQEHSAPLPHRCARCTTCCSAALPSGTHLLQLVLPGHRQPRIQVGDLKRRVHGNRRASCSARQRGRARACGRQAEGRQQRAQRARRRKCTTAGSEQPLGAGRGACPVARAHGEAWQWAVGSRSTVGTAHGRHAARAWRHAMRMQCGGRRVGP